MVPPTKQKSGTHVHSFATLMCELQQYYPINIGVVALEKVINSSLVVEKPFEMKT